MIYSLMYAKLPPKLKRSVNMARLENGSYDEIVARLERELELNALEESDDLPMATMTSSNSKSKSPLSTGQLTDITAITAKKRAIRSRTARNSKRRTKKMPNKVNRLRSKPILSAAHVARKTILRNGVGKAQVHTSNPSATDPRIPMITNLNQKPKNLSTNQNRSIPNLHIKMMIQKTSFATTPIRTTILCPTIHQIGPSNTNFP